jgi:hypothetical protein
MLSMDKERTDSSQVQCSPAFLTWWVWISASARRITLKFGWESTGCAWEQGKGATFL